MSDILVKVEGVSKRFCRSLKRSLWYGMQDLGSELLGRKHGGAGDLRQDEFWALRDVNFELRRGECLGLIGRNGAGKTTLLRLLNGLIRPDSGRIEIHGRVGALIALGAGFNPILTGRENILINASVLGLSKVEVSDKINDIVEFSELGEFLDMPVQSYSSGMAIRLGFAVAVSFEPDIMLVDEVLAVGDSSFQRKCFDKIYRMQERGTSFIVVTHNPYQIERLCQSAAVVHDGNVSPLCDGKSALLRYDELIRGEKADAGNNYLGREGTHDLYFEQVAIESDNKVAPGIVVCGQALRIVAEIAAIKPTRDVRFRFEICSTNNAVVAIVTTIGLTETNTFCGKHSIIFNMESCQLTSGWYYVNAIAVDRNLRLDAWQRATEFKVTIHDSPERNLSSDQGVFVCNGSWEIT